MKLDPNKDILIDMDNLNEDFRKHPLLFYRYSQKYAILSRKHDDLKENMKQIRSMEYVRIKREIGKISDKNTEAEVDVSELVIASRNEMLEARQEMDILKGFVEALRMKKDAMIQISANQRAEDK